MHVLAQPMASHERGTLTSFSSAAHLIRHRAPLPYKNLNKQKLAYFSPYEGGHLPAIVQIGRGKEDKSSILIIHPTTLRFFSIPSQRRLMEPSLEFQQKPRPPYKFGAPPPGALKRTLDPPPLSLCTVSPSRSNGIILRHPRESPTMHAPRDKKCKTPSSPSHP